MPLRLHYPHAWDLSPEQAMALQRRLSQVVIISPLPERVRRVGGVDVSYPVGRQVARAAAVTLELATWQVTDQAVVESPLTMPYRPGLLAFREVPAMLAALDRLQAPPDVLLVDGHGQAHPRGLGSASHLGVLLDWPVVGCAKSVLVGEHDDLEAGRGACAPLVYQGRVVGQVVRTRANTRPVYVSAGQRADPPSAARLVLACCRGFRLPEPIRLADRLAARPRTARKGATS